jgi:hypothetical protein
VRRLLIRVLSLAVAGSVLSPLLLLVGSRSASAACAITDFGSSLADADAVFVGKIVSLGAPQEGSEGNASSATFWVEDVWKGDPGGVATVWTPSIEDEAIGFSARVGQTWLVFTNTPMVRTNGTWIPDPTTPPVEASCSPTQLWDASLEALRPADAYVPHSLFAQIRHDSFSFGLEPPLVALVLVVSGFLLVKKRTRKRRGPQTTIEAES